MKKYKYKALNARGRPITGVVAAKNELDLYNQLQSVKLELVNCSEIMKGKGSKTLLSGIKTRDLIQLFMHLQQMQGASVPLLDSLADIRDTTENDRLRDIMSEVYRDVNEGTSLSEALAKHPKTFTNLYISLIAAGEETGDMIKSYEQLVIYLKWVDDMNSKVKKAVRYPIIVGVVVTGAVVFLMAVIVPQIVGFIVKMEFDLPWTTTSLIATSAFFQEWWWAVLGTPVIIFFILRAAATYSEEFRYRLHMTYLSVPIAGNIIRKISIARFAQTFGALYASGVDVVKSLKSARSTVSNMALSEALDNVQQYVQVGHPLSEAFNASGEFPSMVIRMLRIGEESGNLSMVLEQVTEFYTKDVDEAVQGLITMIEPMLTAVLAAVLLWIAVGVFGPIYLNLGEFI